MRHFVFLACALVGCAGDSPGGQSNNQPDAGSNTPDGGGASDSGNNSAACPLPMTTADTGTLTATATQLCNVPMSGGAMHWYRMNAPLPNLPTDIVQIELWDGRGAFAGTTVKVGMFPVDTDPKLCGVCVRGLGDKGGSGAKEYFATGGMVNVTAVGTTNGTTLSASVSNITFAEIATDKTLVSGGCSASVTASALNGTVAVAGAGGGGGGGGGGGNCPTTVGQ